MISTRVGDGVRLRFGVDGFPYVVGLSTLAALLLSAGAGGSAHGAGAGWRRP